MLKLFEYFSFLLSGITKEAKDLVNSRSQGEILQLEKNGEVFVHSRNSRSARIWCCLMPLGSSPDEEKKFFYCQHSSIIIKQFQIHDFRLWKCFHRRRTETSHGPSGENKKLLELCQWNHDYNKKTERKIIENAKSLIFQLSSDEFIDFSLLYCFIPIPLTMAISLSSKFTFLN